MTAQMGAVVPVTTPVVPLGRLYHFLEASWALEGGCTGGWAGCTGHGEAIGTIGVVPALNRFKTETWPGRSGSWVVVDRLYRLTSG